jgi:prepilin-type N-terminal cleavage/methylation domain-containing protein
MKRDADRSKNRTGAVSGGLDRRGMTLVEMMISISIFAVVLGVVMGFMSTTSRSYNSTRERVQYQQSMRAVMSLLTRDIRSTGCDPTGVGFDRFVVADWNQVRCQMDLNGDADVTDVMPDESVTYTFTVETGEVSRDNGTGDVVILRGVTNMVFTYRDANGDVLGNTPLNALDRFSVRYVDLFITGTTDSGEPVEYTSRVALRNG